MDAPDYPRAVLLVVVGMLLVGLVVGVSTSTTALGPYNYDWDGGSDLRTTLGANASVEVTQSSAVYETVPPADTVAVVPAPEGGYGETDRARLASFVSQGGTLVIASETNETNDLLARLGVTARIDGTPVRDDQRNYRSPAFPRADDVRDDSRVRDVDALTLNHGTVLEPGNATALVNTSQLAYLDANRNERPDDNETFDAFPVAAVESVGAGEVIVVSDGSVFTNAMLERDGNEQFVRTLAADHERAVLDYTNQSLPPLTFAFLQFQASPLVQFVLGMAGLGAIVLWGRGLPSVWARIDPRQDSEPATIQPDEETLAASLARQNPDWDSERVERVTKAILRQQRQGGDDD